MRRTSVRWRRLHEVELPCECGHIENLSAAHALKESRELKTAPRERVAESVIEIGRWIADRRTIVQRNDSVAVEIENQHVTRPERSVAEILPGHERCGCRIGNYTAALESVERTDRLADLNDRSRKIEVGRDEVSKDSRLTAKVEDLVLVLGEVDVGAPLETAWTASQDIRPEANFDSLVFD